MHISWKWYFARRRDLPHTDSRCCPRAEAGPVGGESGCKSQGLHLPLQIITLSQAMYYMDLYVYPAICAKLFFHILFFHLLKKLKSPVKTSSDNLYLGKLSDHQYGCWELSANFLKRHKLFLCN